MHSLLLTILQLLILFHFVVVVVTTNPINGLLNLILGFSWISVLLLTKTVQFFPLVLLIVYVGAIAILFLFTIMLFNLKQMKNSFKNYIRFYVIGLFIIIKTHNLISLNYYKISMFQISEKKNFLILKTKEVFSLNTSLYETNFDLIIVLTYVLLATLVATFILAYDKINVFFFIYKLLELTGTKGNDPLFQT